MLKINETMILVELNILVSDWYMIANVFILEKYQHHHGYGIEMTSISSRPKFFAINSNAISKLPNSLNSN